MSDTNLCGLTLKEIIDTIEAINRLAKAMNDRLSATLDQIVCKECNGTGTWPNTTNGRGVGGQMVTTCLTCNGDGFVFP